MSDHDRYSSDVDLWLAYSDVKIPLAQVAPDWIITAERTEMDPGPVDIIVLVDGKEHRRHMMLPNGISPHQRKAIITNVTT